MDCGGRDTVLQDAYDIDSLVISIETIKRQASSLKCSPVTSGPSEPRRDTKVVGPGISGTPGPTQNWGWTPRQTDSRHGLASPRKTVHNSWRQPEITCFSPHIPLTPCFPCSQSTL